MSILIDRDTTIIVQGITGREAASIVADSLGYGAKVVGGVTPGRKGAEVHGIPVYDCVREITERVRVDASILTVPVPALKDAAFEALDNGVKLLVIVTERLPRRDVAQVLEFARMKGARIIGPNTMGLIAPGKTKVGSVGGPPQDTARAFQPGPIGIMSRSGGMTTELANLLTHNGLGQSTAVSIGGDPILGSTFLDLLPDFEADPETRALVLFCEPGGTMEADLARRLKEKGSRLPVVAFVAGRFVDEMPGRRFGHAGAIVHGQSDTTVAKIALMREAGIAVAEELSQVPALVKARM